MKKRILSILLAALMLFTASPALAENNPYSTGYWMWHTYAQEGCWIIKETDDETYGCVFEIVRYLDSNADTHVVFPSKLADYPVTSLRGTMGVYGIKFSNFDCDALGIFSEELNIEEVTVPDSVTYMGGYSFYNCTTLKHISLSKNTTYIGGYEFYNCTSLEDITIPDQVEKFGVGAFQDCSSLKSIVLPASLWVIEREAFSGCDSLEAVYYGGTSEQWENINKLSGNDALDSATIYFEHPAHSMEYVPSAATCTSPGAAAHYHCTLCGQDFLDEAGETEFAGQTQSALGHEPGSWRVTTPSTCTIDGVAKQFCARCDQVIGTKRLSATGHGLVRWTVTTPATCTEAGVETQFCMSCGESLDTRPVAALGHDYRPVSTTAPTYTEDGYTTFVCRRCGDSYDSDGRSAPGHLFGDWTVTSAPTCTASGVETRYCSRCEASETRPIAPLGHDFGDWTETRAPGCVDEGEESRFCSRCEAIETRSVEAKGHSYGAWEYPTWETCTTDGEEKRVCTVCGDVQTLVRPATGHSFVYGYCRTCWAEDPSAGKITVSVATAGRGNQVELTVTMKNNPGVSSLIIGLDYDDNALRLEDVTNGELFDDIADFDPDDGGGLGTVSFDSASDVTGDGVLMKLTFTVTNEAWTGWYDTGAFVRYAGNEDGDDVDVLWFEGSVFVIAFGDVNGDGSITGMDASLVLQYAANYDDETGESTVDIPLACADVNCDGVVSGMDASLILQYVANFDDETGTSTVVLGPTP